MTITLPQINLEPLIKRRQISLLLQGLFRQIFVFTPADPRGKTGRVGMKQCHAPGAQSRQALPAGIRFRAAAKALWLKQ
jgi:hypothetical protein